MQNEFGTFPAASIQRVRLLRDLSAMTSTLAAGVGSRSFYPWQKGLFREMRAKQGALRV